jgi:hypothetical protein
MIMVGRAHRCIPWANAQQLWLTLSTDVVGDPANSTSPMIMRLAA